MKNSRFNHAGNICFLITLLIAVIFSIGLTGGCSPYPDNPEEVYGKFMVSIWKQDITTARKYCSKSFIPTTEFNELKDALQDARDDVGNYSSKEFRSLMHEMEYEDGLVSMHEGKKMKVSLDGYGGLQASIEGNKAEVWIKKYENSKATLSKEGGIWKIVEYNPD